MLDELDQRKQRVLKAVIDDYIESAEPVGSRTLARTLARAGGSPRSTTRG